MKRREFLATTTLAAVSGASVAARELKGTTLGAQQSPERPTVSPEYYELRLYHLRRGPQTKMFDDFLRDAALPAMKRAGLGPVGVFNVTIGPDSPTLYLLIPHKNIESFATASARVAADPEYQKAGASFLNVPATAPAYVRMESSLMVAFDGTKLEVPAGVSENRPRLFELRTYESHSKAANKKKIEMFAKGGEIAIFRRTGLQPVFFGETLIGSQMPNLTYMLVFENMTARDKNWGAFVGDPEWKKLSGTPGYTDAEIVTNISSVFLRPTAYSQI